MSKINKMKIFREKKVTNNDSNKNLEKKPINYSNINISSLNKSKRKNRNNNKIKGVFFNSSENLLKIEYFYEDDSESKEENLIKGKRYIKNKDKIQLRYIIILIILLIFILQIFSSKLKYSFVFKFSKITLKIRGTGNRKILGYKSEEKYFEPEFFPDQVYINGVLKDTVTYSYYFSKEDNDVELIWNKTVVNCKRMFMLCNDIVEFNFTEFNTSEVTNMWGMFDTCCSLLTSLNISNFDTSKVINMQSMFYSLPSLTSLDLSSFDTSKVTNFWGMFHDCISLTSLNLSNFKTLQIHSASYMFKNCINLEYINIQSFTEDISDSREMYYEIFNYLPYNLVICLDEEKTKNIVPKLINLNCSTIDCSYD